MAAPTPCSDDVTQEAATAEAAEGDAERGRQVLTRHEGSVVSERHPEGAAIIQQSERGGNSRKAFKRFPSYNSLARFIRNTLKARFLYRTLAHFISNRLKNYFFIENWLTLFAIGPKHYFPSFRKCKVQSGRQKSSPVSHC
jgi:hypothetical protein